MTETQTPEATPGTPPNIFDRTLALLREKGWIQGQNFNDKGAMCLGYALTIASWSRNGEPSYVERDMAFSRLTKQLHYSPISWNDRIATSFAEVEAVLETASCNYEAEKARQG
jgi:hypothetical protein